MTDRPPMSRPPLVCAGCAHSASGAPFPGHPSGERPCMFCVRNPEREAILAEHEHQGDDCRHPVHGYWYDGSQAVKVPMDCYQPIDMKEQFQQWVATGNDWPQSDMESIWRRADQSRIDSMEQCLAAIDQLRDFLKLPGTTFLGGVAGLHGGHPVLSRPGEPELFWLRGTIQHKEPTSND